jgi:hypothetical protein
MRVSSIACVTLLLMVAGCASERSARSVEVLDQMTGVTAGALDRPVAFVETGLVDLLDPNPKQATVAYVGPVEWDRSGQISYVLWVQIAPGVGGHRLDDIHAPGAVTLALDDGPLVLSETTLTKATSPYRPIEPVGQTAYYTLNAAMLKRMASSQKIVLSLRASDLTPVEFVPVREPRAALQFFIKDRNVSVD